MNRNKISLFFLNYFRNKLFVQRHVIKKVIYEQNDGPLTVCHRKREWYALLFSSDENCTGGLSNKLFCNISYVIDNERTWSHCPLFSDTPKELFRLLDQLHRSNTLSRSIRSKRKKLRNRCYFETPCIEHNFATACQSNSAAIQISKTSSPLPSSGSVAASKGPSQTQLLSRPQITDRYWRKANCTRAAVNFFNVSLLLLFLVDVSTDVDRDNEKNICGNQSSRAQTW